MSLSARRWLGAILALALGLRLLMALTWSLPLGGDELDYHRLGGTVAAGEGIVGENGRPSSFRPPLYPAVVGASYALFGERPWAVRTVQAVVGVLVVWLTFLMGRRALGAPVGLVAAGLIAVDVGQIALAGRLLSEGVFTAVLLALVLASLAAAERLEGGEEGWKEAAAAGALSALGALTRGILLPYPALLAAGLLWSGRRGPGRTARALAALCLAWTLVLAPWAVRNARAHRAFVPVTTQVGITFYSSQNPPEGRLFGILSQDSVVRSVDGLPEAERSDALLRAGLESLRRDPGRIPLLEALKLTFFFVPIDWEVLPWYGVLNPAYGFALAWACVAFVLALRRGLVRRAAGAWALWLPGAFFLLMALVFYGSPRLRIPAEPLLGLAAAWALVEVAAGAGWRRSALFGLATYLPLLGVLAAGESAKAALRTVARALGLWS